MFEITGDIALVFAMDAERGIGWRGELPWGRLSADMRRFRRLTEGRCVLMGRATADGAMGLVRQRDRTMMVLTNDFSKKPDLPSHMRMYGSVEQALRDWHDRTQQLQPLMVVGGKQVFDQLHPVANRAYVTLVGGVWSSDRRMCDGFDLRGWTITAHSSAVEDGVPMHFLDLWRPLRQWVLGWPG